VAAYSTVTVVVSTVDPFVAVIVDVPGATPLMPKKVLVEPAPAVTLTDDTWTIDGALDDSVNVRSVASSVSESIPRFVVSSSSIVIVGPLIVNTGVFTVIVTWSDCPFAAMVMFVVPFAAPVIGKEISISQPSHVAGGNSTVMVGVETTPPVENMIWPVALCVVEALHISE
jgi:hypothetical protein